MKLINYTIIGLILVGIIFYITSKKMGKISKNFSLSEFENSRVAKKHGIKNKLPDKYLNNVINLTNKVLQPVRDFVNFPISITSGYRSPELITALKNENYKVAPNTQHAYGMAVDIVSKDNAKVFDYIKNNLEFDQLIWEYGKTGNDIQPEWIHVSYNPNGNRKQILYI